MADEKKLCSAEETAACCCVDVGTIIDTKAAPLLSSAYLHLKQTLSR